MLARQVPAHAAPEILLIQRIIQVVHFAVLHVGEAGVADAHLHVGVGAGAAPLGTEAQQQIAALDQPALGEPLGKPGAPGDDEAQSDVALGALGVGMLEIDKRISGFDVVGKHGAGARRHREEDRDVELLRHALVHLLVEGEGLGRCGGGSKRGARYDQQREQPTHSHPRRHNCFPPENDRRISDLACPIVTPKRCALVRTRASADAICPPRS